jgi:hypothetical protein
MATVYFAFESAFKSISARYQTRRTLFNCSESTISKFQHLFVSVCANHIPRNVLGSAVRTYILSCWPYTSEILDTFNQECQKVLYMLQHIGFQSLIELELSVVVTERIREMVTVEFGEKFDGRYATALSSSVETRLVSLIRQVLRRNPEDGVGEETLKAIALSSLTDLRCSLCEMRELTLESMNCMTLYRNFLPQHQH